MSTKKPKLNMTSISLTEEANAARKILMEYGYSISKIASNAIIEKAKEMEQIKNMKAGK